MSGPITAACSDDSPHRSRVRERLAAAGHEGPVDSVRAVRTLREAVPGLSLRQAVKPTKNAAAYHSQLPPVPPAWNTCAAG